MGVMRKGFTLLELLVVISIIGILVTMGAVAFSTAQRKGRDAKRHGDIKSIQSAYEQYYADNNSYDVDCSNMGATYQPGGGPTDPQTGAPYSCTYDADSYCVCGLLDEEGSGNASDTACTFGAGDYYCVTNLQ